MTILITVAVGVVIVIGIIVWRYFFSTKNSSLFTWIPEHIAFDIDTVRCGNDLIYRLNLRQDLDLAWELNRMRIPSSWDIESHNWDGCVLVLHLTNGSTYYISPSNWCPLTFMTPVKKEMWEYVSDEVLQSGWERYGNHKEAYKEYKGEYISTIEEWQRMKDDVETELKAVGG